MPGSWISPKRMPLVHIIAGPSWTPDMHALMAPPVPCSNSNEMGTASVACTGACKCTSVLLEGYSKDQVIPHVFCGALALLSDCRLCSQAALSHLCGGTMLACHACIPCAQLPLPSCVDMRPTMCVCVACHACRHRSWRCRGLSYGTPSNGWSPPQATPRCLLQGAPLHSLYC